MGHTKQNNSIFKKIIETLKVPFSLASSIDTNDQDIFSECFDDLENISVLRSSTIERNKISEDYRNSIGIPTKKTKKTGVETSKTKTTPQIKIEHKKSTVINPILSNNNDKNISLFKNDDFTR